MMILLQRTQELDIHEWREIREQAYTRFGKEEYKKLLQERDERTPDIPRGSIPTFDGKRIMFGAMKEEHAEMTPEWSQILPEVYEGLKNGQNCTELLQKLLSATEEEAKMKKIRKCIRMKEEDWEKLAADILKHDCGEGFRWMTRVKCGAGTPQLREQWKNT
jgi:hypothetical protein